MWEYEFQVHKKKKMNPVFPLNVHVVVSCIWWTTQSIVWPFNWAVMLADVENKIHSILRAEISNDFLRIQCWKCTQFLLPPFSPRMCLYCFELGVPASPQDGKKAEFVTRTGRKKKVGEFRRLRTCMSPDTERREREDIPEWNKAEENPKGEEERKDENLLALWGLAGGANQCARMNWILNGGTNERTMLFYYCETIYIGLLYCCSAGNFWRPQLEEAEKLKI